MNLLLVAPDELDPERRVRLAGRRARHLLGVLGVSPGRVLRAGVFGEGSADAEVLAVGPEEVVVRLGPSTEPSLAASLDLVLALPRPKALRRVLRLVATLGIGRVDLVNAWRVETSYFASPVLAPDAIARELRLGAEQGGIPRLPEVALHRLLMPFLEELGERFEGAGPDRRWIAHPGAAETLGAVDLTAGASRTLLAIGPEGGWIERELASFHGLGFRPISLGPWILPVYAAIAVAAGQLALLSPPPRSRAARRRPQQSP